MNGDFVRREHGSVHRYRNPEGVWFCHDIECWCHRQQPVRTPAMQAEDTATAEVASGARAFPLLTQGHDVAMDALWIFIKLLEELNETDRGSVLCYVIARYTNEGKAK